MVTARSQWEDGYKFRRMALPPYTGTSTLTMTTQIAGILHGLHQSCCHPQLSNNSLIALGDGQQRLSLTAIYDLLLVKAHAVRG